MSETDDNGFLAELDRCGSTEFWGNKAPMCPHCGAEYNIDWNEHWSLYNDDDRHECTCGECNRLFYVRTITSHSFCTDEQDDLEPPAEPEKNTAPQAEPQAQSTI